MTQTPLTIFQLPNLDTVQGSDRLVLDRVGAAVTAGSFVVGQAYQIINAGNTSFTAIGAESNTVGAYFVATGAGTGTGTAGPINTGDAPLSAVAALLGGDPAGTAAAAVADHAAAADPHPTYTTPQEAAAAAPVQSVNGQTGIVILGPGDVGAATAAQGTLASTAVQPAALSSTLSSYLTIASGALTYQPLDADLTAIAALTTTSYGRSALTLANAAAGRSWLELGTAATAATGDFATPAALSTGLAGKADLIGGVVATSQIPAIALVQYLGQVGSQAAMLALRGQGGDWCIRTDQGIEWVIVANDGALLADWVQMPTPTAGVSSINGQTGAVTLGTGDLGESGGNLFFTAARAIGAALTGFTAGAGTVAATDSILQAFQKVVGNIANRALAGLIGSSGLTMATNRLAGRSTAGVGAVEEIAVTSPLQLASGAFSLSSIADGMIFKATNRGETGTASTNYDELPVAVTNGTFAITGIYFGCHIDSVGTGTATFNAYRRTAAGVKTSLLTANATLSAGASLVDATSLLTGATGITAGTRVGFDILGFGGATGVFVLFLFNRTQV
ncbi:MAG: hypothetical protein LW834_06590 [Cyanobium sp. 49614_E6]|jgi:hypothetical protein|nr:hypothetical protein [Cyanobium sp. 49614_E6]